MINGLSIGDKVKYVGDVYKNVLFNPCIVVGEDQFKLVMVQDQSYEIWHLLGDDLEAIPESTFESIEEVKDTCVVCTNCACEEEIETNDKGGKNSKLDVRFDLLPPLAINELAKVLEEGSKKYEEWNWINVNVDQHINHGLNHIFSYLNPNNTNEIEELSHAFCRIGMALDLLLRNK